MSAQVSTHPFDQNTTEHDRMEIELFFENFFFIILNERGDKNMYMWKFSWGIIMKNKKI